MSTKAATRLDQTTRLIEEALRRATWEATQGPPELRAGRFDPYAKTPPAKKRAAR